MKRNNSKRITAAFLASILAAAALWGCAPASGAKDENRKQQTGTNAAESSIGSGTGSKENSTGSPASDDSITAKGRYVETALPMPKDIAKEWVNDVTRNPAGEFEMYTQTQDEIPVSKAYRFANGEWKTVQDSWVSQLPQGSEVHNVRYAEDGSTYITYYDADYKTHLARILEDGTAADIPVKELEGERANRLSITGDGQVFIPLVGDKTLVAGQDGSLLAEIPQRFSWSDFCDSQTLTKDSYVTTGDRGFVRFDLDGREQETIPYQTGEQDISGSLAAGEGNDFYLCNPQGIHHMAENGTIWETIVDGTLNSLGMPSISVKRLFVGNDGGFYVWYVSDAENGILHYTFDPDMPSAPSENLTVYGLDLSENQTIRQAASLFQMEHPNVRVEVIDGNSGAGGTTASDTIRALNTELLNGSGADVLVLDGLPVDSYIEKGILADLKDVVGPMAQDGTLYQNMATSFVKEDGSVYQFPSRVAVPVVYGQKEMADSLENLDSLKGYLTGHPDQRLIGQGATYEGILWQMIHIYYPELMDEATGYLSAGQVQKLLETVKLAGDISGSKVKYSAEDMNGYGEEYNRIDTGRFYTSSYYSLATGDTGIAIERNESVFDFAMAFSVLRQRKQAGNAADLTTIHGVYYPKGLLGVTSQSKAKETALEFVRFVLSETVQDNDLSDGFPVNQKSIQAWQERELPYSVSSSNPETGFSISAKYPEAEDRKTILGMLGQLTVPIIEDRVLTEMIVNETRGYFDGSQTAAEAAEAAVRKAKIYEAE